MSVAAHGRGAWSIRIGGKASPLQISQERNNRLSDRIKALWIWQGTVHGLRDVVSVSRYATRKLDAMERRP
jgi:hypothetical protein